MREITVKTREELETALEMKYEIINVEGELAEKIKRTESLKKLGTVALTTLIGSIIVAFGAAPVTGGLSLPVVSAFAATTAAASGTAISSGTIIAIVAIGASLILTLYKDYDIEVKVAPDGVKVKLKLKLKNN